MSREHFDNEAGWSLAVATCALWVFTTLCLCMSLYFQGVAEGKVAILKNHNCTTTTAEEASYVR